MMKLVIATIGLIVFWFTQGICSIGMFVDYICMVRDLAIAVAVLFYLWYVIGFMLKRRKSNVYEGAR